LNFFISVPPTLLQTQEQYLARALKGMRDLKRKELCLTDVNIKNFLLYSAFKKIHGQSVQKNLRATANIVCRFFDPLWIQTGAKNTTELLVKKNAALLQRRLIEFGGIQDFYSNTRDFITKIKNRAVGLTQILQWKFKCRFIFFLFLSGLNFIMLQNYFINEKGNDFLVKLL
jgi:hypothetical protein